jgi:hypothetical protein
VGGLMAGLGTVVTAHHTTRDTTKVMVFFRVQVIEKIAIFSGVFFFLKSAQEKKNHRKKRTMTSSLWQQIQVPADSTTFLFYDYYPQTRQLRVCSVYKDNNLTLLTYHVDSWETPPTTMTFPKVFFGSVAKKAASSLRFVMLYYDGGETDGRVLSLVDLQTTTYTSNKIEPPNMQAYGLLSIEPTTAKYIIYSATFTLLGKSVFFKKTAKLLDNTQPPKYNFDFVVNNSTSALTRLQSFHWMDTDTVLGYSTLLNSNPGLVTYNAATSVSVTLLTFLDTSTLVTDTFFTPSNSGGGSAIWAGILQNLAGLRKVQVCNRLTDSWSLGYQVDLNTYKFDSVFINDKTLVVGVNAPNTANYGLYCFYDLDSLKLTYCEQSQSWTSTKQPVQQLLPIDKTFVGLSIGTQGITLLKQCLSDAPCLQVLPAPPENCPKYQAMTQGAVGCDSYIECGQGLVSSSKTRILDKQPMYDQIVDSDSCQFVPAKKDALSNIVFPPWNPNKCTANNIDKYWGQAVPVLNPPPIGGFHLQSPCDSGYMMNKCVQPKPLDQLDSKINDYCKLGSENFTATMNKPEPTEMGDLNKKTSNVIDAGQFACGCTSPPQQVWQVSEFGKFCDSLGKTQTYDFPTPLGPYTVTKNKKHLFDACSLTMQTYCEANPSNPTCVSYCNKHGLNGQMGAWCPTLVGKHCEQNPKADECACIQSKVPMAICNDSQCWKDSTYKSADMLRLDKSKQCPDVCQQIIDINGAGKNVNIDSNTFNFQCNLKGNRKDPFELKTWYNCDPTSATCIPVEENQVGENTDQNCCSPEIIEQYKKFRLTRIIIAASVSVTLLVAVILLVVFI